MISDSSLEQIKLWLGTGSVNIFGRPFSGKDTQGEILAKIFDGVFLSGGAILRQSDMSQDIKDNMKTGELTPSNRYIDIVLPNLSQKAPSGKPLFLSSFGRWSGEEDAVIIAAQESGHPIKAAVHLRLSETEVEKRWQSLTHLDNRGDRHDDNTLEILKIRLKEYEQKTLPVLATYKELGILVEINGDQSIEDVSKDILQGLLELSSHA